MKLREEASRLLGAKIKKSNFRISIIVLGLAIVGFGIVLLTLNNKQQVASKAQIQSIAAFPIPQPTIQYGLVLDTFQVSRDTIQNNEFLADILLRHKVPFADIDELARATKDSFDVRGLRADRPYTILAKDTSQAARYFIYEPSVFSYVIFDLQNKTANKVERPVSTSVKTGAGIIQSSLWNAMTDNGMSFELAASMEDALAWSIDFHHIQKEDRFKLVYEERSIDGQPVGIGKILGAYYKNVDNEYYAIHFENEKHAGYYDLEARSMEKAFLKAPVKYSRISSRYNLRRFHPVLRRTRPHFGTDYAAPTGTPIYAVADGLVIKRSRTRGNGNFVKLKHDDVYQTQYLHMSRFAPGVNVGTHVKQGQTIGFVGQTGLANGPHVCFRFWKNGKQVNHLKENLPPPDPMPAGDIPRFNIVKDEVKAKLDQVVFKNFPTKNASQPIEVVENKNGQLERL